MTKTQIIFFWDMMANGIIYIYIYIHTHTHTHTDVLGEGTTSLNLERDYFHKLRFVNLKCHQLWTVC